MSNTLDVDRFCISISNYIDQEVMPQYDGLFAFSVKVISNIINRNGINFINHFSSFLKASKIMTMNGQIDIDEFANILGSTFDQLGKLSVGGLTYSKKDLDKLVEIMKSYIPSTELQQLNNKEK